MTNPACRWSISAGPVFGPVSQPPLAYTRKSSTHLTIRMWQLSPPDPENLGVGMENIHPVPDQGWWTAPWLTGHHRPRSTLSQKEPWTAARRGKHGRKLLSRLHPPEALHVCFFNTATHCLPGTTASVTLGKIQELIPSHPSSVKRIIVHVGPNDTACQQSELTKVDFNHQKEMVSFQISSAHKCLTLTFNTLCNPCHVTDCLHSRFQSRLLFSSLISGLSWS